MAAYAALVSAMHIIDTIEHHHSPPVSIDKQQVESLTQILNFLQEFLESYKSPVADGDEADPLEMRIADAAHAVEDVIESHIVNVIKLGRSSPNEIFLQGYVVDAAHAAEEVNSREEVSCIDFYQDLQQVIEELNVIKKEAMETQLQRKVSLTHAGSSTSSSNVKESVMVGFDDVQLQLLDWLTGGNRNRQIIPITGMGGIGKTTLARHIFEHALVKEHFDIRAWTTISQTYNVRETLRQVLHQVSGDLRSDLSEEDLGVKLRKYLLSRSKYLIILDDMWSVEVWKKMMVFFLDKNDGSRIVITTRLSNLATELTNSNSIDMRFLDDVSSWSLFSKTVFGGEGFPLHLEEIGKKIVGKCKGLPLSIAVIGGLLAKSELTQEYWKHIEENIISSIVNSENDEYCLRVLKLSYDHLPAYLKPCFLYMGMFGEDQRIGVSELMTLWVSEGFLKPIINKSSKTIAKEYLKDLVDRNLILVHELGAVGNIKYCKMHDLVRNLSFQEAEKQRFYYVLGQDCPRGINSQRRIVIPRSTSAMTVRDAMETMSSRARSFICHADTVPELLDFRFLRTILTAYKYSGGCLDENVFQMVNLRYLSARFREGFQIPSSISLLWNLHTLIVYCWGSDPTASVEIWKMHQLKHVEFKYPAGMYLPDPRSWPSDVMMENLETLKGVLYFNLNEEMVKRIPNIKKLYTRYMHKVMGRVKCLSYLQCLSKLESLTCIIQHGSDEYLQSISFPHSLKKLSLHCENFYLEEILEKIASLPLLQKFKLFGGQFATGRWEIVEGQFPSLKYLRLWECRNMKCWTLEGSCLPRLEQLHLRWMNLLEELPSEIGEIPTLKSIQLLGCSESAVVSLKMIVEEQEELQGDPPFHVIVN